MLGYALDHYYITSEGRSYFDTPYKAWTSTNDVCLQDKEMSDKLRKDIGLEPLPESAYSDCSKIEIKKADFTKPIMVTIPE